MHPLMDIHSEPCIEQHATTPSVTDCQIRSEGSGRPTGLAYAVAAELVAGHVSISGCRVTLRDDGLFIESLPGAGE